jgi:hypothetical protein
MDDAGRLRCFGALDIGPGPDLLGAAGEEGLVPRCPISFQAPNEGRSRHN